MEIARWGKRGSPLLPATLRRALADEPMPGWLLEDLGLPENSTALAMDSSVWRHLDRVPKRAERFLLTLISRRLPMVVDLPIADSAWPSNIEPVDVPWPARVRTALEQLRALKEQSRLESLTFGDLSAVRSVGVKTILEYATVLEALALQPTDVLNQRGREEVMAASEEDWAERIRADDPRFRDALPAYTGTLGDLFDDALSNPDRPRARVVVEGLPAIRERVLEVSSDRLDDALACLLSSRLESKRDVQIVRARLGWGTEPARTLQDTGDEFGLSRERVRQIVKSFTEQVRGSYMPQVERALHVVAEAAPILVADAAALLVSSGVSNTPIDPRSLQDMAELFGYEAPTVVDDGLVVLKGTVTRGPVLTVARRQSGRSGVSNFGEVAAELLQEADKGLSDDAVAEILRSSARIALLVDDWFWMPEIRADRNRLRNVVRKMLSVCSRLDLASIRIGVRRRQRFMGVDLVPPIAVLRAFLSAHPEFVVDDEGYVTYVKELDYRVELGEVERTFVEVLRTSPTGLMDRAQLEEAATARGMNPNTFSVFTTYSPILDHPAINVWCLRGHKPNPAQVEALRSVLATRTRLRRTVADGWDDEGRLWLTVKLGNVNSPVIGIPSSIAHYVAGRRFQARTIEGQHAGTVAVSNEGTSWGYGPFLRRRGAEVGDAITIRFDLVKGEATLSLGDDEDLGNEEDL